MTHNCQAWGYSGQQWINMVGLQPPKLWPTSKYRAGKTTINSQRWSSSGLDLLIGWMIHHFTMRVWVWFAIWATQMKLRNITFRVKLYCHALCFCIYQIHCIFWKWNRSYLYNVDLKLTKRRCLATFFQETDREDPGVMEETLTFLI